MSSVTLYAVLGMVRCLPAPSGGSAATLSPVCSASAGPATTVTLTDAVGKPGSTWTDSMSVGALRFHARLSLLPVNGGQATQGNRDGIRMVGVQLVPVSWSETPQGNGLEQPQRLTVVSLAPHESFPTLLLLGDSFSPAEIGGRTEKARAEHRPLLPETSNRTLPTLVLPFLGVSSRPTDFAKELDAHGFSLEDSGFSQSQSSNALGFSGEFSFIKVKIEEVYSHLADKEKRWSFSFGRLWGEYAKKVARAADEKEYLSLVREFLATFHDGHLQLKLRAPSSGTGADVGKIPPSVTHTWMEPGILVTKIARLWGNREEIIRDLEVGLTESKKAKALVVDLRGNGGGDDSMAFHYISRLVNRDILLGRTKIKMSDEVMRQRPHYAKLYTPDSGNRGWSQWRPFLVRSNTKTSFPGAMAVLIDKKCYSSCESAAQAFKNSGIAKLYGQTTGGGSANPIFVRLPVTEGELMIPTWIHEMANGQMLEDNGVTPDVALAAGEDALQVALSALRSSGSRE